MTGRIRIIIADDQALVRGAVTALLSLQADIEVVAECADGAETVDAARRLEPDVCLLDIEMPGMDGLTATQAIRALPNPPKVLIVTTFGRIGYLKRALDAGASGFTVKTAPAGELAEAVRRVHRGLRAIDPVLARESLSSGTNPLTARECDVLRLSLTGDTIAGIAGHLGLSPGTVRNHISHAMAKTHAITRTEAAVTAREHGWI